MDIGESAIDSLDDARSEGVLPFSPKKSGKRSCSGLMYNSVILSDKSDREILNKKLNTLSEHPLDETTARFFPTFFLTFFVRAHLLTERHIFSDLFASMKKMTRGV